MNRYTKKAQDEANQQLEKIHMLMLERNFGNSSNFLTSYEQGNKNYSI